MAIQRTIAIAIPVLLVAALTACGAGTGSGGDPSSGGTASGHSDTACLSGKNWNLDVQDAAQQLLAHLQSSGSPATSATGEGSQQLFFDEAGTMGSTTDVNYVVVSPLDNGLTLALTQHQTGPANGEWAWIGDTNVIRFSDWISNLTVSNTININGTESSSDTPLPTEGGDGTDMTVVCSGDNLTTTSVGSPFTMHFTAEH
jgi:hypothetical protein